MITEVKTAEDLTKLPAHLQFALRSTQQRTHRYLNNIERATRKTNIQAAVARSIREGQISYALGVEILQVNNAYGPEGKKALSEFTPD